MVTPLKEVTYISNNTVDSADCIQANVDTNMKGNDTERKREPYPNHSDDPDPFPEGSTKNSLNANAKVLCDYSHDQLVAYKNTKRTGETFCRLFVAMFSQSTINTFPRAMFLE